MPDSAWEEGTMASAEIAFVCGLKFRNDCQNRLCMNSDADETLAYNGKADKWMKHYLKVEKIFFINLQCNFSIDLE